MDARTGVAIFNNLTLRQYLTLGGGLLLLLVSLILNCVHKNLRWRGILEARTGHVTAEFLALRDLPKHAYNLVANEARLERATTVKPAWRSDCGWGAPSGDFPAVHFRTFVASSLHILEKFAVRRDERLVAIPENPVHDVPEKSPLACDVAEYLERIRATLSGELNGDLCSQYLEFFKNARVPGQEMSEAEFRAFLGVFQEILKRLQR